MPLRRYNGPPPAGTPAGTSPRPPNPSAAQPSPPQGPSPLELLATARNLAQSAAEAQRSARELLARALAVSENLARSVERSQRRSTVDTIFLALTGALLCIVTAFVATLVTLAAVYPQTSVPDLFLRILFHRS